MSPRMRGLAGIPVYAFIFVAAGAGQLFSYPTPAAVQIGVYAAINIGYGFALGTWWAMLVPGLASLLSIMFFDEPSPIDGDDRSAGAFLLIYFVLPASAMILAGVAARKVSRRLASS